MVKLLHTAEILNQKVFPPTPADCVKRCRGHLASQALGSGPETDMPNLLCIHLTRAFLRMHCHTKPLTKLMFGTDQKDFWPEFRTPFLSPLCLLFLHPAPCEVSDSFSLVSSIWQYVLEKKDKCSNRTYPFSCRGGRGKQTVFTPYFLLFVFVNKLESLDCFFSLIVRISGHWVLTVCLFMCKADRNTLQLLKSYSVQLLVQKSVKCWSNSKFHSLNIYLMLTSSYICLFVRFFQTQYQYLDVVTMHKIS